MLEDPTFTLGNRQTLLFRYCEATHLFNCYSTISYWIVPNIATNEQLVEQVLGKMKFS